MRRPLAIAVTVATLSIGLLVLTITEGWLGPDVGRGANFCEAARDGLVRQPADELAGRHAGDVRGGRTSLRWRAARS